MENRCHRGPTLVTWPGVTKVGWAIRQPFHLSTGGSESVNNLPDQQIMARALSTGGQGLGKNPAAGGATHSFEVNGEAPPF